MTQRPELNRITINLTQRTAEALDQATHLTSEGKTDVINKAIQLYTYIRQLLHDDGALYLREPGSTEKERLKLL